MKKPEKIANVEVLDGKIIFNSNSDGNAELWPPKEEVEWIKENVRMGSRIVLNKVSDAESEPSLFQGAYGVVDHIDDTGTIFVKWNHGSSVGVLPGRDCFTIYTGKTPLLESVIDSSELVF